MDTATHAVTLNELRSTIAAALAELDRLIETLDGPAQLACGMAGIKLEEGLTSLGELTDLLQRS